jgi:hypothetical protein
MQRVCQRNQFWITSRSTVIRDGKSWKLFNRGMKMPRLIWTMCRSIMRMWEEAKLYCCRRPPGSLATLGRSMSCRLCRAVPHDHFQFSGTGHSSKPDHGTRSASSLKTAPASRTSEDRPDSGAALCARGQIAQALAIGRPNLIATLTIAAAGAGIMPSSDAPGERRNTDEEEVREHGFEHFIRGHVENTHVAFGAQFYKEHPTLCWRCRLRCEKTNKSEAASLSLRGAAHLGHPRQRAESKGANLDSLRRG